MNPITCIRCGQEQQPWEFLWDAKLGTYSQVCKKCNRDKTARLEIRKLRQKIPGEPLDFVSRPRDKKD